MYFILTTCSRRADTVWNFNDYFCCRSAVTEPDLKRTGAPQSIHGYSVAISQTYRAHNGEITFHAKLWGLNRCLERACHGYTECSRGCERSEKNYGSQYGCWDRALLQKAACKNPPRYLFSGVKLITSLDVPAGRSFPGSPSVASRYAPSRPAKGRRRR